MNKAARKKKALKAATPTNRRFSREFFKIRGRVIIQDQINKKWEKRGTILSSCPTHTDQGACNYQVQSDDGNLYSKNSRFLSQTLSLRESRLGRSKCQQSHHEWLLPHRENLQQ